MSQRYVEAFASLSLAPLSPRPACRLSTDGGVSCLLVLAGVSNPDTNQHEITVPLAMDRDEASGLADWLCRALTLSPTTTYRSLYALRSGKLVGIETDDGHSFILLGGAGLIRGWQLQWRVLTVVTRYDINGLVDSLAVWRQTTAIEGLR